MISSPDSLQVVVSVDVEEDGLGCGRYPRIPPGLTNVAALQRLEFLPRDFGLPLTLLATYPVVMDDACASLLRRWRESLGAEIGAHLHPWNTPPFSDGKMEGDGKLTPLDAEKMAILRAAVMDRAGGEAHSFRMGRFAVSEALFDDVQRAGFQRESSVVPYHVTSGTLEAYSASSRPYCLRPATDSASALWEIPLTTLPICSSAGRGLAFVTRSASRRPWQAGLQRAFQRVGVVGVHPAWFSLPMMCWAARMQVARGGRLIHIFLHSSELLPGCVPAYPTEQSVQALVNRLSAFLRWLVRRYPVAGVTLSSASLN